ncbi:MAG: hypothetical protein JNK75_10270, partial [Betaproteobacteria bacterium]|nr:hypothetical protein [Betaproteobacteria bacterium]
IGNGALILARWLGAMAFLLVLVAGLMVTMMVMQAVRGVPPIEPLVFARTYLLMLLPTLALAASVAVAADSTARLMGKGGDVLYFMLWFGQFATLPIQITRMESGTPLSTSLLAMFDVSGMAAMITRFEQLFGTKSFSIGGGKFDPALPAMVITDFWTAELVAARLVCTLIATLPLVLAVAWFHRYSPDKVRPAAPGAGQGMWARINRIASPATRLIRPAFGAAQRLPGVLGQVVADAALVLAANPLLFAVLGVLFLGGWLADGSGLKTITLLALAAWGVLVSDLAARDAQSGTDALSAVAPGGPVRRYARQLGVTFLIGAVAVLPAFARWIPADPVAALTLAIGLALLTAFATLLARLTRGGRTFLGIFLLGLYLSTQLKGVRWFDAVGVYAAADDTTRLTYFVTAGAMMAAGWFVTQRTLK